MKNQKQNLIISVIIKNNLEINLKRLKRNFSTTKLNKKCKQLYLAEFEKVLFPVNHGQSPILKDTVRAALIPKNERHKLGSLSLMFREKYLRGATSRCPPCGTIRQNRSPQRYPRGSCSSQRKRWSHGCRSGLETTMQLQG